MIKYFPPKLRSDCIIVAHADKPALTAMAISYLFEPDTYLPVFRCSSIDVSSAVPVADPDIYAIHRRRMEVFDVFLTNAIAHNGGCDQVLLVGLTENQKSYLKLDGLNVWEITDENDIVAYLSGFGAAKKDVLEVGPEQLMAALPLALTQGKLLKTGLYNAAVTAGPPSLKSDGLAVIEDYNNASTVIAVNYAIAAGMEVALVAPLGKDEEEVVLYLLEDLNAGVQAAKFDLLTRINQRVADIPFDRYAFVTFFTRGLPYTLVVTELPTSYVNLIYAPDFFIHFNFIYERRKGCGSAVVFSPGHFYKEEIGDLLSLLEFENFYTRKLLGKQADVYNLRTAIELYPFDLLHICTHGGDVQGTRNTVNFTDKEGKHHIVEFDTVLSISLTPFLDLHQVQRIYYFKKLNGLAWKSPELRALNHSHELYASLIGRISHAYDKKQVKLNAKLDVPNSNSISCSGFNYQAIFEQMSAPTAIPIVFNNSCWSWSTVSNSFLHAGARGYIGTLMPVNNDKASRLAKLFYDEVFETNVMLAFHNANSDYYKATGQTNYIYYGLHFSTLKNNTPNTRNRAKTIHYVAELLDIWKGKLSKGEGVPQMVKGIVEDLNWLLAQLKRSNEVENIPFETRPNQRR